MPHLMLAFVISMFGTYASADVLDKDGIVRNADGTIHLMDQSEAVTACPSGTHLPTPRELIAETQTRFGAKGIVEISDVPARPAGYQVQADGNNYGTLINGFYYSNAGYRPPTGDMGTNSFWTPSVWSCNPDDGLSGKLGTSLDGKMGSLDSPYRDTKLAVRCFPGVAK
jgi:hypothetical protein